MVNKMNKQMEKIKLNKNIQKIKLYKKNKRE